MRLLFWRMGADVVGGDAEGCDAGGLVGCLGLLVRRGRQGIATVWHRLATGEPGPPHRHCMRGIHWQLDALQLSTTTALTSRRKLAEFPARL